MGMMGKFGTSLPFQQYQNLNWEAAHVLACRQHQHDTSDSFIKSGDLCPSDCQLSTSSLNLEEPS